MPSLRSFLALVAAASLSVPTVLTAADAPGTPRISGSEAGILPRDAEGKPLNMDFETGTLKDWTAEGDAFEGQPIKGDTVSRGAKDMRSQHQGQFWIGGVREAATSRAGRSPHVPFKVTHPWASFLVGGGPHSEDTRRARSARTTGGDLPSLGGRGRGPEAASPSI